jgi:hypothetical protein
MDLQLVHIKDDTQLSTYGMVVVVVVDESICVKG